jgi:hypothetical protein
MRSIEKEKTMSLKHFIASGVLALTVATGAGGLAAHASPSAGRATQAVATNCQTTVLQQAPLYNHVTIHGYGYLMRDLCDGNVFLRVSTDLWGAGVSAYLNGPTGPVSNSATLVWGGHIDTPEVPYISGATYTWQGYVTGFWLDTYSGSGAYTAP